MCSHAHYDGLAAAGYTDSYHFRRREEGGGGSKAGMN